jgi:hypothetical protein
MIGGACVIDASVNLFDVVKSLELAQELFVKIKVHEGGVENPRGWYRMQTLGRSSTSTFRCPRGLIDDFRSIQRRVRNFSFLKIRMNV